MPSDSAFQRWHPIDWGFYPFSVPDFTETIMRNHVIQQKQPFILKNVEKEQKMKAIGGEYVVFRNARRLKSTRNSLEFSKNINFSIANGKQRDNCLECDSSKWK